MLNYGIRKLCQLYFYTEIVEELLGWKLHLLLYLYFWDGQIFGAVISSRFTVTWLDKKNFQGESYFFPCSRDLAKIL